MREIDLTALSRPTGGSDPLRGYLFTPDGAGPWPGLVLIHEIFGFDEAMRRHSERLAEAGCLTLAVDLFSTGRDAALPDQHHARHDASAGQAVPGR